MNSGKLVFAQLTQHLPLTTFRRCVARYGGEHKVKSFSCLDQYLCMAFAQLTYRESLRDIEACLRAQAAKLYHMGIKSRVSRSTLADANEVRDWRIYADFAQSLYWHRPPSLCRGTVWRRSERDGLCARCQHHRFVPVGVSLGAVSLDQSSHQAAHAVGPARQHPFFPPHQRRQAPRCQCPRPVVARARRLLHHGPRLYRLRAASSPSRGGQLLCHARQIQSQSSASLFASGRSQHRADLRSDHRAHRLLLAPGLRHATAPHSSSRTPRPASVWCSSPTTSRCPPSPSPSFIDAVGKSSCSSNGSSSIFVSKSSSALRENAVKTQIWIAVSVYVLVAIVKKRLNLSASLYEMLQILSLTMFERIPLDQLLNNIITDDIQRLAANQLNLFD